MTFHRVTVAVGSLVAAATLAACGSAGSAQSAGSNPAASPAGPAPATATSTTAPGSTTTPRAAVPGAYLGYDAYQAGKAGRAGTTVVYFFHAPWCPDCKATDTSLTSAGVPDGLTVVKVDYDSMTDLKRTYGVRQQHTFVQVGEDGRAVASWTGSRSGAEIKAKTG